MQTMDDVGSFYLDSLKVIIEIRYASNFIGNFSFKQPTQADSIITFICVMQRNTAKVECDRSKGTTSLFRTSERSEHKKLQ